MVEEGCEQPRRSVPSALAVPCASSPLSRRSRSCSSSSPLRWPSARAVTSRRCTWSRRERVPTTRTGSCARRASHSTFWLTRRADRSLALRDPRPRVLAPNAARAAPRMRWASCCRAPHPRKPLPQLTAVAPARSPRGTPSCANAEVSRARVSPHGRGQHGLHRNTARIASRSSALGGVVNVVRDDIPESLPEHAHGSVTLHGASVDRGGNGSATLLTPLGEVALRGEGSVRRSDDVRTPLGTLANTDGTMYSLSGGAAFVPTWGHAGVPCPTAPSRRRRTTEWPPSNSVACVRTSRTTTKTTTVLAERSDAFDSLGITRCAERAPPSAMPPWPMIREGAAERRRSRCSRRRTARSSVAPAALRSFVTG